MRILTSHPVVLVLAIAAFAAAAFAGTHYYGIVVTQRTTPQILATSTEAVATTTPAAEVEVKAKLPVYVNPNQPEKIYIGVPATQPTIEITNGVKNEGSGVVNVYNPPQTQLPQTAPVTPVFVEPRPMTTLEVANDIVDLYDTSGTAELYGDNMLRVYIFGGKSVTIDLTAGWEEKLKATLNKIKH